MKKTESNSENTTQHKKTDNNRHNSSEAKDKSNSDNSDEKFPGYPHYPPSEDIYNREKEVNLNPEDLSKTKKNPPLPGEKNEKDFLEDMTGEDLDVPGNKADETKANSGQEDEENNYYSLGGDNHNDLEEN